MKFQTLPILATILATTQAAPTSELATHHLVTRASRCQNSSFENQVSGGSPLIRDCEQLSRNIAGGGTWTMGAGGEHRKIASYGTCAFELKGSGGGTASVIQIGNQDIMDLIRDSIGKGLTFEGKVGAKGKMSCQEAGAGQWGAMMGWAIYHN